MSSNDSSAIKPLAVVTGASSGIGLALAREFAGNGFDLILVAEGDGLATAARELEALGARVDTIETDLATFDGVESVAASLDRDGRPIDAAAINAGVGVGGPFLENDLRDEMRIIDLNVTSTVHLAKHIVPSMAARKAGRILFTSSIAAIQPDPYEAVYGASKAFVRTFAESLRAELKDTGVSVTTLMPGVTDTNFFHRAGMDDTKAGAGDKDDPADVARQGFKALMDGTDHIVAGSLKTRAQGVVLTVAPEAVKAELHRGMAEPGSAKN